MPESNESPGRGGFRERLSHYLIAFSLFAKGIDKLEHYHHQLGNVILIFCAGLFIVFGSAFHDRLAKRIPNFTALFHVAEGTALLLIGLIFFQEGNTRLPYFYLFLGAVFCVIGIIFFAVKDEHKERMRGLVQLWIGIAFLAAGLMTLVLNQAGEGERWVIVISFVFAAGGTVMVVRALRHKKSRIFPD